MKRTYLFLSIVVIALSSCSKKEACIKPKEIIRTESTSVLINNVSFIKTADIYAVGSTEVSENNYTHTSSFNINNGNTSGTVTISFDGVPNKIAMGEYSLINGQGLNHASISYIDENGAHWTTNNIHQKGSKIEVTEVVSLNEGSYFQKIRIKTNCYISNGDQSIPIEIDATTKF